MRRVRIIPVLLLSNGGVVKTTRFAKPHYIGDPINAVRIFNQKEVDELAILDIDASKDGKSPDYEVLEEIASEAFMPIAYGGGISSFAQAEKAFQCGLEKVVLNTSFWSNAALAKEISEVYGSQSVVVAMDVKKKWHSPERIYSKSGQKKIPLSLEEGIQKINAHGAGEILLTSIDHEGMMEGMNLELIHKISSLTDLPLIANGGARNIDDFYSGIQAGASAIAAGSQFVYAGKEKGILINYPKQGDLELKLYQKL